MGDGEVICCYGHKPSSGRVILSRPLLGQFSRDTHEQAPLTVRQILGDSGQLFRRTREFFCKINVWSLGAHAGGRAMRAPVAAFKATTLPTIPPPGVGVTTVTGKVAVEVRRNPRQSNPEASMPPDL